MAWFARQLFPPDMRVLVQTSSPATTLLESEASTLDVGGIKEEINRLWNIPIARQQLVCCGRVLEDSAKELPGVCLEGSEPLWLVTERAGTDGVSAAVLASLFPATGASPSNLQDQGNEAIHLFGQFCLGVAQHPAWQTTDAEWTALDSTADFLRAQMVFFAPYACALMWEESNVGRASLQLICLDEHVFFVHSGTAGRAHSARVGEARVLPVGTVPIEQLEAVLRRSQELLTDIKHECNGKDQRIGWEGKRGHQKTPAFIFSIFADVLRTLYLDDASWLSAAKQPPSMPRGGFTDVGKHSDSQPRDTTWSLVEAVVQDRLEAAGHPRLFQIAMAQLRLWVVEVAVAQSCAGAARGDVKPSTQISNS